MKKHIFGVAIFSFIVGTAAILYGFLNVLFPVPDVNYLGFTPEYNSAEGTHCKFKSKINRAETDLPIISQAIYSVKTNKLTWKCTSKKMEAVHIWVTDQNEPRYIRSFFTENCTQGEVAANVSEVLSNPKKLPSQANLYLIPDATASPVLDRTQRRMAFDIDNAIPVTIDYGK